MTQILLYPTKIVMATVYDQQLFYIEYFSYIDFSVNTETFCEKKIFQSQNMIRDIDITLALILVNIVC